MTNVSIEVNVEKNIFERVADNMVAAFSTPKVDPVAVKIDCSHAVFVDADPVVSAWDNLSKKLDAVAGVATPVVDKTMVLTIDCSSMKPAVVVANAEPEVDATPVVPETPADNMAYFVHASETVEMIKAALAEGHRSFKRVTPLLITMEYINVVQKAMDDEGVKGVATLAIIGEERHIEYRLFNVLANPADAAAVVPPVDTVFADALLHMTLTSKAGTAAPFTIATDVATDEWLEKLRAKLEKIGVSGAVSTVDTAMGTTIISWEVKDVTAEDVVIAPGSDAVEATTFVAP